MPSDVGGHRNQAMPQSSVFTHITTQAAPASDRFDYWRQLFVGSHLDKPRSEIKAVFNGEMLGCADPGGVVFANLRADPLIATFGKRDSDLVLLGCVRRGALQFRQDCRTAVVDANSGLVLVDCDRPAVSSSTAYDLSYLALPRSLVASAMGRDPTPKGTAVVTLPNSGLTPMLLAVLSAMSERGAGLDRQETATAMEAATSLALALLARLGRYRLETQESLDDAFFASARRYMDVNCWRQLTADDIAAAIGCSRAHLYRLFAKRGETVAGCLRDVRLKRARRLLQTEPSEPIGQIAFNTGYTDPSAFGKAFKHRFGMSPSECRAMAMTGKEMSQGTGAGGASELS